MQCKPEEFVSLIFSLINDLNDPGVQKYKRKLVNGYINNTVQMVHSRETSLNKKFFFTISMVSIILQLEEQEDSKYITKDIPQEIKTDLIDYLCKQEISKIRAIIIDLYTGMYTDDQKHGIKPEPWALKTVEEISTIIPIEPLKWLVQPKQMVMKMLHRYLLQEIKEAFVSKAKPFGRRGNQLIINILYIEKYFKKHWTEGNTMKVLLEEIRNNFKDKKDIKTTEELMKYTE
ncbi:hypothetical protein NEMIN01_2062 [Nematocida minor]|uniref:uncharacterized protein n=1 Tax=Nematocida minor TaxID=1912983 RepID=UPI0022207A4C|nr:uncharacterized protein NEMIN01_2062 [Nematocida minor]KAI5192511.1 hypothetical protein NEMIN01_2062 [Nematocida minor]